MPQSNQAWYRSPLLCGLLSLYPTICHAEIWICDDPAQKTPTFTNAPINSDGTQCHPNSLSNAAYNKVASEKLFHHIELASTRAGEEASKFRPKRTEKNKHVSFSHREVAPKKSNRHFETECLIRGTARSAEGGQAEVRVTRGALTTDKISVQLPSKNKPVKWTATLPGPCRNPLVTLVQN